MGGARAGAAGAQLREDDPADGGEDEEEEEEKEEEACWVGVSSFEKVRTLA